MSEQIYWARFKANPDDFRSVVWPVKYPYWCSGYGCSEDGIDYSVVVAYVTGEEMILEQWPEATEIDMTPVDAITFSDRFPRPEWYQEVPRE